jgi:hypothetical protein
MRFRGLYHLVGVQIDEVVNKFIWSLRFDPELPQRFGRKVLGIVGNNYTGAAANRGRQDMAIIRVRQIQSRHELPVPDHEGIGSMLVHELPRALQLRPGQVWPSLKQVGDPFFVNVVRPSSTKETWNCQKHQEAAKVGRIQNVGVKKSSKGWH